MADTCRGDFPDKYCSGCGLKHCDISNWNDLIRNKGTGYFDSWCFGVYVDFYNQQGHEVRLPAIYNFDTGESLHPKISFSELGKENKVNKEYFDFEMTLESAPGECNCDYSTAEAGSPHKPGCLSKHAVVGFRVNDQILVRILPIEHIDFSQPIS